MNPKFQHKGLWYEILSEVTDKDGDEGRGEQILRDFQYCESKGDWMTIKNRIKNGLKWGWLKEISFKEEMDIVQMNNEFW